jgi:hypothetical protein
MATPEDNLLDWLRDGATSREDAQNQSERLERYPDLKSADRRAHQETLGSRS